MVNYTCYRCGFTNNIKSRFINHLNRKFICKPILKDIKVEEIYQNYFGDQNKNEINKCLAKLPKNKKMLPKSLAKLPKSLAKLGKVSKEFTCKYCDKIFLSIDRLNLHMRNIVVKKVRKR